ncbi:MAG: DNA internalization-related competence protein ComEC/Rec2 [Methylocystaceae bacterium]
MVFSWQYAFLLLAMGIAIGSYWPITGMIVVATLFGGLLVGWLSHRLFEGLFITGFLILGCLLSWRILPLPPVLDPQTTTLVGVVQQIPTRQDDYNQTIFKCANQGYYKYVVLYLPANAAVKSGDTIKAEGKLSTLKGPRNPGDPNRRLIKGYQHLYYQLKASDQGWQVLKPVNSSWRQNWYDKFVLQAKRWMPPRSASILTSVIWGDAAALNDDDYRLFQEIGLLHVFAASGMNVGCLMLAAALLTGLFTRRRGLSIGVGLAITMVYAALIGWPVSVMRAALMALFASLAYLGGRKLELKESLFLAATLLLIIDPGWLFNPGFQLTVIATWGLMILCPALTRWWFPSGQHWWQQWLLPIVAAELAVWPLTVYYFNLVAPVSLLANLLLAPLISILVILGTMALFTCPLPAVATIFWLPGRHLLDLIMIVTTFLHTMPGGYWWVKAPPLIVVFAYFIILWWLAQPIKGSYYRYLASGLLVGAMLTCSWPRVPSGNLVVTFLDVGQGDSIHISTAQGKQILIDGGGSVNYPTGRLVVLPYLHRQGINHLDLAVSTHPHDDHWLGLLEVLQNMPASHLVFSRALQDHPLTAKAIKMLPTIDGYPQFMQRGDQIKLDNSTCLQVLSPDFAAANDVNNASLVLLLSDKNNKILLMGDAEAPVAQNLRSRGLKGVTVIKIGHHGSTRSRSPEFYQAAEPQLAIISVGKNNGFGHPSPLLLQDLKEQHIKILRTDLVGGIRLLARSGRLEVQTYAHN